MNSDISYINLYLIYIYIPNSQKILIQNFIQNYFKIEFTENILLLNTKTSIYNKITKY